MPMMNVASIHGIIRWGDILGTTNLLDASGQFKIPSGKIKVLVADKWRAGRTTGRHL